MKVDFKSAFWLSIPVTAAVFLISYLFGKLGVGVNQLFSSVDVTSGVTQTVGNKVLSFVGGYVPITLDLPTFFITMISAFVAIIVGSLLVTSWNFPAFKGNTGRLASIILWGALPVYLILVGFKIPSISVMIGLAIHTFAVAYLAGWLGGFMKKVI